MLPGSGLGDQLLGAVDATIEALGGQHANLDFHHVQPAGVFGNIMELQAVEQAPGFGRREGLIECAGRVGRKIIQHMHSALGK